MMDKLTEARNKAVARIGYGNIRALEDADLVVVPREMMETRAGKLLRKSARFVVIRDDEPYYIRAYSMIRECEMEIGRWTDKDEAAFQCAFEKETAS